VQIVRQIADLNNTHFDCGTGDRPEPNTSEPNSVLQKNLSEQNSCGVDLGASPPQLFGRGGDRPYRPH